MKKRLIKVGFIIMIALGFFTLSALAQFGQFMKSNNDLRNYALNNWASGDEQREQQVASFVQLCLVGGPVSNEDVIKEIERGPQSNAIESCAKENNYTDIYDVVRKSDKILTSTAWPLSILVR